MRVVLAGVRGSTPAPGPDFVRYGGSTSCVGVMTDGDDVPRLVLDAGTGLSRLSARFGERPFTGTILLGHLHWDHTHGLPFFPAGGHPDAEVHLAMPAQGEDPERVLERAVSPPHFPVTPSQLGGRWRFSGIDEGRHELEGFQVEAREIPHKGGRCFGYRITDGTSTVAYLSDHSPISLGPGPDGMGERHEAAMALAGDADLLIHDAQYTRADFGPRAHFGHSTVEYAIGLAEAAAAKALVLFHHDPARTDDELDRIVAGSSSSTVAVSAAVEGSILDVGRSAAEGRVQ